MITTYFYLCALPRAMWEQDVSWNERAIAIHSFVKDAIGIERRIQKGVNQDNERTRYNLCCARIEATVVSQPLTSAATVEQFKASFAAHRLPASALEAGYLTALAHIIQQAPLDTSKFRFGASFYTPDMVASHNTAFSQLAEQAGLGSDADVKRRRAFFELARQFDCGVVELQNAFQFLKAEAPAHVASVREKSDTSFDEPAEEEEVTDNESRDDLYAILEEQIQKAIEQVRAGRPGVVNFSNQPHNVITEVLNEFVYQDTSKSTEPTYIQVVYTDGSRAEPFPLLCLPGRTKNDLAGLDHVHPLRVSLMSMRHLEMDDAVDMAWFRNSEVSKSRTLAETDMFCYEQTRRDLEGTRSEGKLRIYLYQTGFQPAVIGFYRALVEELLHRAGSPASLEVTPYYFSRRNGYWPGQSWN
jgi:hypothetical protein